LPTKRRTHGAISARQQAEAIELDLMNPIAASGRQTARRRKGEFNKAGGTWARTERNDMVGEYIAGALGVEPLSFPEIPSARIRAIR
jgi:hypothetical protein